MARFEQRHMADDAQMFGPGSNDAVPLLDVPDTALPVDFDWQHNRSVITPVKNQSTCGGSALAGRSQHPLLAAVMRSA